MSQTPMRVQIKDGANQWWFAVLAKNVGGSGEVTRFEVFNTNNKQWQSLSRQSYNYWVGSSGAGFKFPLQIRVWQGTKSVTGTIPSMSPGATFQLTSNF